MPIDSSPITIQKRGFALAQKPQGLRKVPGGFLFLPLFLRA
jgi:hypothetical protein